MVLENALYIAKVSHHRVRPKRNGFCYGVYYLSFPLQHWQALSRLFIVSLNRFNLFSVYSKDYGDGNMPEEWMREALKQWHIPQADGDIVLVTMPRVLGHAFNPVSFWFCLDAQNGLRAVLAEVSNTFGERHSYLIFHDDRRVITSDDWLEADKVFHVSPFIEVNGSYSFRFAYGAQSIGVWINHQDQDGLLLTTSMVGKRFALTSRSLLRCFFRYPLVTLKVVTLIHYQALKLFAKGVRYRVKPNPPAMEISR